MVVNLTLHSLNCIIKVIHQNHLSHLVGKGVTFDTGGISLKSARDLSDMRMDMGGAAAVAGAVKLLAATNAKVNVVGINPNS